MAFLRHDDGQDVTGFDIVPYFDTHFVKFAVSRCRNVVLHLHSFQYEEDVAAFDIRSFFDLES